MGAQQIKEVRSGATGSSSVGGSGTVSGINNSISSSGIGVSPAVLSGSGLTSNNTFGAGSSIRASRIKSRQSKDTKIVGSNIFTEHSGKLVYTILMRTCLCMSFGEYDLSLYMPQGFGFSAASRLKKEKRKKNHFRSNDFFPFSFLNHHSLCSK